LAALQAMNIASGWDLAALPWDSPERLHRMVEAMRLAFADARQYIADIHTNPCDVDALLSDVYAAQRRALVSSERAMQPPAYGLPFGGSNTVYLSVVDGQGNACSFINSLYMGFGTGIVAKGTGVFLQNRGACFNLEPGHPNCLAGGKRPYHTIIPGMALKGGELWASFGVMGGFMQPQGHFQVMSAMLDDDLNPVFPEKFLKPENQKAMIRNLAPPPAAAATAAAPAGRVQRLSFDDDVVTGRRDLGDGDLVRISRPAKHSSLVRARESFVPELIKSAEDI
jgi:gamma-glutamyltranspeptidase